MSWYCPSARLCPTCMLLMIFLAYCSYCSSAAMALGCKAVTNKQKNKKKTTTQNKRNGNSKMAEHTRCAKAGIYSRYMEAIKLSDMFRRPCLRQSSMRRPDKLGSMLGPQAHGTCHWFVVMMWGWSHAGATGRVVLPPSGISFAFVVLAITLLLWTLLETTMFVLQWLFYAVWFENHF